MKISTFSIVCGGRKCNAKCPYCVSKMTKGVGKCDASVDDINIRNFKKACSFAKQSGVSTALLTGVGEPLLYPKHITKYLSILQEYDFPFIELQTNGIELDHFRNGALPRWYTMGLDTVSLSVAHWVDKENQEIFGDEWKSLKDNIRLLHDLGFSVRLSCVMVDGWVNNLEQVKKMIAFCQGNDVEQLTCRPVGMPDDSKSQTIKRWVTQRSIDKEVEQEIADYFARSQKSTLLLELPHGANVYDYDGQNISINNCLTHSTNPDEVRQLIFAADGHLRYSWTYPGAILI
jgi:molybdenum cofactor biosynthesis enzyme MoaA